MSQLPFLDTLIINNRGKIQTNIFYKQKGISDQKTGGAYGFEIKAMRIKASIGGIWEKTSSKKECILWLCKKQWKPQISRKMGVL